MRTLAAVAVFALAACSSQPVEPTIVKVAVRTPCITDVPVRPVYLFETLPPAKNEADATVQIRVLWKDREAADLYGRDWEAAAAGCLVVQASNPGSP